MSVAPVSPDLLVAERTRGHPRPQRRRRPRTARPGLAARHLAKHYRGRTVLRDVSLTLHRGEAVGLLGPNGAGKTTCFYIITGLIAADAGRSCSTSRTSPGCRCTAAPGSASATCRRKPRSSAASTSRTTSAPCSRSRCRTASGARRCWSSCSTSSRSPPAPLPGPGAFGRRAAAGRDRARPGRDPSFILLDEPLAGIDPINVAEIRDLVGHLKDRGLGVLITDHNVRDTLDIIDRAYILHDGAVLREGTPDRDRRRSGVRRVYLGERFSL